LDCLSGIIEKKKQQLKELDALAQSIFCEMFGNPVENERGWEVKKLGEEFEISSGGTPDTKNSLYWEGGDISWIGSNMCHNDIIYQNDGKYITNEGLEHSSAKMYQDGYVIVALVGATIGKTALLKFPTTTNQNVAGINVPSNRNYTPEYVFYLIQNLYELFQSIGNGKFKMANLSFIRSLPLIVPPLSLQQEFASKIEAIEKQKELLKQSIAETETLFNSRMDYYFN
jgi:type I restriction enzyme S subunit